MAERMLGPDFDTQSSDVAPQSSAAPTVAQREAYSRAGDAAVERLANGSAAHHDGPVRVLVTGYGAFMSVQDNPTAIIAERLQKVKIPGAIVKAVVLPVQWKEVDAFVEKQLPEFHPDVVISMGFSAGHHEVKEFAVNHRSGEDAAGVEGGGVPITEGGPEFLRTTLPVDRILREQKRKLGTGGLEGVNHTEPDDDYLCNYIEYRELTALKGTGVEVGFLHISDADRDGKAVEALLSTVVSDVKNRRKNHPTKPKKSAPAGPGNA